ncbi:MAG: VOC family protein [Pseudomonadota bacterium]
MSPVLSRIDHAHLYVASRDEAACWYASTLDLKPVKAFAPWAATPAGPLVIANAEGSVHLALFQNKGPRCRALAFGASAADFLAWHQRLTAAGIAVRLADHELAWSLYFDDPDGNSHEITTYEHAAVREVLATSD